jgi:DNA-binding response OmpR family regulator
MLDTLLVDEEQGLRDVLEEQLVERGHHVETADDGAAGAESVKRRMFDVIMLGISRKTLWEKLRSDADRAASASRAAWTPPENEAIRSS